MGSDAKLPQREPTPATPSSSITSSTSSIPAPAPAPAPIPILSAQAQAQPTQPAQNSPFAPPPPASAPSPTPAPSSIPQKRAFDDDHSPAVSSPLNPEISKPPAKAPQQVQIQAPPPPPPPPPLQSSEDGGTSSVMAREKRAKKDSLKKRESKGPAGTSAAATTATIGSGWGGGGGGGGGGGTDSARATPEPSRQQQQQQGSRGDAAPAGEIAPMRYKLAQPKPSDFELPRGPVFTSHHEITDAEGREIEFFETSEHVYNKKNFQYTHCIADPAFPSMLYYRHTEPGPYGAHMSFEDTASYMFFDRSGRHVTSNKGFRMARANVAVREGRWYWECKITQGTLANNNSSSNNNNNKNSTGSSGDQPGISSHGHVRVGWARREASLDAPVGFDAYSYGIRDVAGQKVHMSRPQDFFPPGEELREGDVVGLEIRLPSERLHRKIVHGQYNPAVDLADAAADSERAGGAAGGEEEAPNVVRDRIPIRFKAHIYFEKIDYHATKELEDLMNPAPGGGSSSSGNSANQQQHNQQHQQQQRQHQGSSASEPPNPTHPVPCLRTLPNSYIRVYKNGVLVGTPFTNLLAFLPPASKPLPQPGAREGLDDGALGYYPAVSVFRGGAAEVNFGPRFWYPPPGYAQPPPPPPPEEEGGEDVEMQNGDGDGDGDGYGDAIIAGERIKAVCERYDEQIVEDVVYDIIDEVGFWVQDGCKVITDRSGAKGGETAGLLAPGGREEIKELVQDD